MAKTYRDLDPEDFPQPWQRPPFEDLLVCLKELHIEPRAWTPAPKDKAAVHENRENTARYRRAAISYLSSVVSNALRWLEDDEQREVIWDEASRCLSQRCGRAGMGELTRTWPFQDREVPFELQVREPPITGDSLGHKTWGSSYLLAQLLDGFKSGPLSHLLTRKDLRESLSVLELGSGTGLLGIAAAAMWQVEVVLSDLPDIMPNLQHNLEHNQAVVERLGGKLSSGTLVWGSRSGNDAKFARANQFDIILAADGIYDDNHPELLSSAIQENLLNSPESRAVVMVPLRDDFTKTLIEDFQSIMKSGNLPLIMLEDHYLVGQDDWGDDGDPQSVECWWAIFGRQPI
ncbi:putative methyltransferase-domain-containing protein [Astrocystis sublimbata]|nr:putative methyltransferase-domain-containing protein [Astrocystis sublimbata]